MDDQRLDMSIYGAQERTPRQDASAQVAGTYTAPEAVPATDAVRGSALIAEGEANLRAAQRQEATVLESTGAAMAQWLPAKAWEAYSMPKFAHEPDFNAAKALVGVQFPLDEEQEKFLLHTSSQAEFDHKYGLLQDQRVAYEAMGDHAIASTITAMADPGYLAIDAVSLGAGRLANAARMGRFAQKATSGATAFAGAYLGGKIEQQVSPVSETEVVLNALANGAATHMFYDVPTGKVLKKDEHFPDTELTKVVQDIKGRADEVIEDAKVKDETADVFRKVEDTAPVKDERVPPNDSTPVRDQQVPPVDSAVEGKLPKDLAGAKPRYKTSSIEFESDYDKAMFITSQSKKSEADEAYRQWLRDEGFTDAQIEAGGKLVRDALKRSTPDGEDVISLKRVTSKVARKAEDNSGVPLHKRTGHSDAPTFRFREVSGRALLGELQQHADPLIAKLAARMQELLGDDIVVRYTAKSNLYQKSRAYYHPAQHAVYITEQHEPRIKLHELAHAVTSHKLHYGLENPHTAHGKIASEIEALRQQAKAAYKAEGGKRGKDGWVDYHLSNVDEFVAGLYSGTSSFTDLLLRTKTTGGASLASKFVGSIRKLLGLQKSDENALTRLLGLTEKLQQERLNVTIAGHSGGFSIRLSPDEAAGIMSVSQAKQVLSQKLAKDVSWSLHKTLSRFSDKAKEIADLLVDDPLSMTGDSVTSQHRAIRADLHAVQYVYEDLLKDAMAAQGFGVLQRILKPKQAVAAQVKLERDVALEMLRRNRASMDGAVIDKRGVPEHVTKMADALDAVSARALDELKRAGVAGAEDIAEHSGYFSRRWDISKIEGVQKKLMAGGLSEKDASAALRDMIANGIRRANGWDAELAQDVSKAILDRTKRQGYFEDSAFRAHQGADAAKEVRDLLTGSGLTEARIQRVLDVLTGVADEKGKASHMKHRIDMAMDEGMRLPNGESVSIADLIDMNMAATTERYLDSVATQAAFARKGFASTTDVRKLREDLLHSIESLKDREEAAKLFDQTLNSLRGLPTGEDLPDFMRKSQAVTQMVGLAASGLWQVTEYATAMMQYGAARTLGHMVKEMPGIRALFDDVEEATHLRNVLARNSTMDVRMRPYVQRMEDGFEIPVSDSVQLALQQAKQLVPYINAMKYIQRHQARTVGNLVVNTFERAAKGDAKAIKALEQYGLESHTVVGAKADILQYGMDTAKWSQATWDAVRGPLTKMMDDAVLKARTGEIPAFAQFTQTGKFLFTFRSFTLAAHNKILAGTMHRDGFAGLGLLMLYQFPLTVGMTALNNTIQGKKPVDDKKLIAQSLNQMGSLGLAGELLGIITGEKQQFGSPGLIGIDRMYKTGNAVFSGNAGHAGAAFMNSLPIISLIPGVKAIGETLK